MSFDFFHTITFVITVHQVFRLRRCAKQLSIPLKRLRRFTYFRIDHLLF